jgi:hypothetical protein
MQMVCIRSYLKAVLRYNFFLFWIPIIRTPYIREQGCEDLWLLFEAETGSRAKQFGQHWYSG